jgi:polysaccharide pyruvyl transferase WcaK-like protein
VTPLIRTATLFGYLGGRNLGDDAMLEGLLSVLPRGWRVIVLARDPAAVVLPHGVEGEVLSARPRTALAAFRRSDAVIRVGGTSFHDEYAGGDRLRMAFNYAKLSALFLAARAMGKAVGAFGVGAGRMTSAWTRACARAAYRACSTIIARDPVSARAIAGLGVSGVIEGVDLAFLSPAPPPGEGTDLGLSLLDLGPFTGASLDGQLGFWARLAREAQARSGARALRLLVFKDNETESDLPIARRLATELAGDFDDIAIVAHGAGLGVMRDTLAGCALVVATRYHAAILGAVAGQPVVIVPYNDKLRSLADDLGLAETDLVAPGGPVDTPLRPAVLNVGAPAFAARKAATGQSIARFFDQVGTR